VAPALGSDNRHASLDTVLTRRRFILHYPQLVVTPAIGQKDSLMRYVKMTRLGSGEQYCSPLPPGVFL
jgi:hypothetical protein